MCRLFGLHAGTDQVGATFWLLHAPDSLAAQSRRNPDGAGIGVFDLDGTPVLDKQPLAAWQDRQFLAGARELRSTTFIAHVRYASTGSLSWANTHPFAQDGRLFAHNGVLQDLTTLDARLDELGVRHLVEGETDSERLFALITAEARRHGGDLESGLTSAIDWISHTLPVYSLNLVLTTPSDLWALRYPATHELWMLVRPSGGTRADGVAFDARTTRIRARSDHLATRAALIVASEPMDTDPGWAPLSPGELLHAGPGPTGPSVHTEILFPDPPRHLLGRTDLDPATEASQHP